MFCIIHHVFVECQLKATQAYCRGSWRREAAPSRSTSNNGASSEVLTASLCSSSPPSKIIPAARCQLSGWIMGGVTLTWLGAVYNFISAAFSKRLSEYSGEIKGSSHWAHSDRVNTLCIVSEGIKSTFENTSLALGTAAVAAVATMEAVIWPPCGRLRWAGCDRAEAAAGMMDGAAASCSYMMEGDFQSRWHQLLPPLPPSHSFRSHGTTWWFVYSRDVKNTLIHSGVKISNLDKVSGRHWYLLGKKNPFPESTLNQKFSSSWICHKQRSIILK